jgi:hypothetical protein
MGNLRAIINLIKLVENKKKSEIDTRHLDKPEVKSGA